MRLAIRRGPCPCLDLIPFFPSLVPCPPRVPSKCWWVTAPQKPCLVSVGCAPAHGSSPRLRETRDHFEPEPAVPRFIPAIAENTTHWEHLLRPRAVHLRDCGKHFQYSLSMAARVGSSQRLRGKSDPTLFVAPFAALIPRRRAGNTGPGGWACAWDTVHPREFGKHRSCWKSGTLPRGSSPIAGNRSMDANAST